MAEKFNTSKYIFLLLFSLLYINISFSQTNFWNQIAPPSGGDIQSFAINVSNHYFVGLKNKGIYRSTDRGSSWQLVGLNNTTITALNIKNNIIFAGSENDGVFTSSDNGESWQLLNNELIGKKINVIEFYNNLILFGTENGLFYSNFNGSNLTQITNEINNSSIRSIKVSESGNIYIATSNGFVYSNNLLSFQSINSGLNSLNIYSLGWNTQNILLLGSEDGLYKLSSGNIWRKIDTNINLKNIRSILLTNDNKIYIGNEKLYYSADTGKTFATLISDSLFINQIQIDKYGSICFISSQGIYRNQSNSWIKIGIPQNLFINQIITDKSGTIYSSSTDGLFSYNSDNSSWQFLTDTFVNTPVYSTAKDSSGIIFIGTPNGIYKTTNNGKQWIKSNAGLLNFNINQLQSDNGIQFCATKNGLFRSTDNGGNWKQLFSIPINVSVNCLQKLNDNIILAGTSVGLYISKDNGNSWQQINIGVSGIEITFIEKNKSGVIIAGNYYSLYKSTDLGETWKNITNNFINGNIKCIAINPAGEIYAGTNLGVYKSINDGATFTQLNSGLTNIDIRTMAISEKGYLFCGSNGGGLFISISLSPETPKLESPPNNSKDIPKTVTLKWTGSSSILLYRVQVSENSNFSQPLFFEDITLSTSVNITNLKDYTTYYWRVNGSNAVGESDWSDIWNFTTLMSPPAAPTLIYPSNNEDYISQSPIFRWNESNRANYYELQVSEKPDFSTVNFYYLFIYSTQQIVTDLKENTTYYWRVRGVNIGGSGPWSSTWSFKTISIKPYTPNLLYPGNLSNLTYSTITFRWNKVINANYYSFILSTNQNFNNNLIDTTNYQDTSFTINLNPNIYYWKVKSHNSFGESSWSTTYGFILKANDIKEINQNLTYELAQNYPNPFNPSTTITFSISKRDYVKIIIYDSFGKAVDVLVETFLNPGKYSIVYHPNNLSSGIYFYKLISSSYIHTKKMIYLK